MSDDITTVTLEEAKALQSETDWEALEAKTDEEIRDAVESDPDAYFLDEDWFESATFVDPSAEKEHVSIRLDKAVLEFFRAGEHDYQNRINKILREYVAAQQYKERQHRSDEVEETEE